MSTENISVTELGFETPVKAYPRPKRHDPSVIEKVAEKLADKVKTWLSDDSHIEDIEKDLVKALDCHEDGYDLARELDRIAGYMPDAALVEILDEAGLLFSKVLSAASAQWLKECCIQPPPLLAKVTVSKDVSEKVRDSIGQIIRNHDDGRSTVRFNGQAEGCGYIIEWEKLILQKD